MCRVVTVARQFHSGHKLKDSSFHVSVSFNSAKSIIPDGNLPVSCLLEHAAVTFTSVDFHAASCF